MANPIASWLDPLPANAPDIEGMYERSIPRWWPDGIRFPGTEKWYHREAIGVALASIAHGMWLLKTRYMPQNDTGDEPIFMHLWEAMFNVDSGGTTAERIKRVILAMRTRGTLNDALLLALFAPVFGVDTVEDLAYCRARPSQVTANGGDVTNPDHEQYYKVNLAYLHVYSISGTLDPDLDLGAEVAARARRCGMNITFAKTKTMRFGAGRRFFSAGTFA